MKNHKKVIDFPVGQVWKFYDWVQGESNPVDDWYRSELSDYARSLFDAILKNNSKTESHLQWQTLKMLKGGDPKTEAIWEFKFCADNKQFRVLGIFADERKEALLLIGCYHKQKRYHPPSALETAVRRAREFRQKKAGKRERQIKHNI